MKVLPLPNLCIKKNFNLSELINILTGYHIEKMLHDMPSSTFDLGAVTLTLERLSSPMLSMFYCQPFGNGYSNLLPHQVVLHGIFNIFKRHWPLILENVSISFLSNATNKFKLIAYAFSEKIHQRKQSCWIIVFYTAKLHAVCVIYVYFYQLYCQVSPQNMIFHCKHKKHWASFSLASILLLTLLCDVWCTRDAWERCIYGRYPKWLHLYDGSKYRFSGEYCMLFALELY